MDRVKYKEKAKEMIAGNKWYLWKPLVMFSLTVFVLTFVILLLVAVPMILCKVDDKTTTDVMGILGGFLGTLFGYVETVFLFGYTKYTLGFVRGKTMDWKEPIKYVKGHFVSALIVSVLVALMVIGGTILLIVPGIIIAIGHAFVQEVFVDNGHKMDIFVFGLSFLGWILLVPFTLGILCIWLVPYITIALQLVYEDIVKKNK